MSRRTISTVAFILAGMLSTASALEVRPLAQIQFPGKTKIAWEDHGKKDDPKIDADLVYEIGTELLANTDYVRYGFGLAYKSAQKKGDVTAAPATIPVWLSASFGLFNKQALFQPYAVARFGTLAPLTSNGNWWESPLNFMVEGGAGVVFPYNIGLEVVYDYSSVKKSFKSLDKEFRISSGRVGIQLSVGINLGGDNSAKPAENSEQTNVADENTAAQDSSSDSEQSNFYSNAYAEAEQESTETDSSSTDSATTDYAATETAEQPEADSVKTEETAEEPSSESDSVAAPVAEEPEPAPETEAAPEPEPEVAPAPAPEEPKPAAKKTTKKSSKKASKKSSKKAAKKSTKKTGKKKK